MQKKISFLVLIASFAAVPNGAFAAALPGCKATPQVADGEYFGCYVYERGRQRFVNPRGLSSVDSCLSYCRWTNTFRGTNNYPPQEDALHYIFNPAVPGIPPVLYPPANSPSPTSTPEIFAPRPLKYE